MQMLNQANYNNNNKNRIKKSQIILIGSLLVFIGIIVLGWNSFLALREEVYSDLKLKIVLNNEDGEEVLTTISAPTNVKEEDVAPQEVVEEPKYVPINYDQYLGVLEIPKIGLKRGFYGTDNKYNDIRYNVTMVKGSTLPDVEGGNLILVAHSGDAYISFFAYLWRLNIDDVAYVTYNKVKYTYKIIDIYEVPKVGQVTINKNTSKSALTLITCTKNNDYTQTVYILEQV